MAKLTALPSQAIIDGFRGVVDFYISYQSCDRSVAGKGIPCARSWPRSPGHDRAPAVQEQWSAFGEVAGLWKKIPASLQAQYNSMASGTGLTGRDIYTRGFISGLYRYPTG